jgi:hypothetical protein
VVGCVCVCVCVCPCFHIYDVYIADTLQSRLHNGIEKNWILRFLYPYRELHLKDIGQVSYIS